jgi:predicted HicB family RNase H-like nuclease
MSLKGDEHPARKRHANGKIMVRIGPSLHEWLLDEATRRKQSMNQLIESLIRQEMEELNDESSEVY